jgi:hypothetical protein
MLQIDVIDNIDNLRDGADLRETSSTDRIIIE